MTFKQNFGRQLNPQIFRVANRVGFPYNLVSVLEGGSLPSPLEFLIEQKWLTDIISIHKFIISYELGLLCNSFSNVW